ncbi:hypothetical protein BH20VER2_BH20VER2_06520 [soil metagenome]
MTLPRSGRLTACLLALVLVVLAWSGIAPKDRPTWWLEVAPVFLGIAVLFAIRRRFRVTPLLQTCIALHMIVLAVGGHYTYAKMPLGDWFRETFQLGRNHHDRLGHFAQGFVPALIAREVVISLDIITKRGWIAFFAFLRGDDGQCRL